jgi:hypothetical protein
MRSRAFALFMLAGFSAVVWLSSGCGAIYLIFGEGGLWPPGGTGGVSGTGPGATTSTTTTQPATISGFAFSVRQLDPLLESTAGARVIVPADMNNDGFVDFVSGSAESQPIQLHLRNGNAIEYTTITIAGGAPISTMYDLAVADFDADGFLDVAVLVNDTGFVPVATATKRGSVVLLFAPPDTSNALAWQSVVVNATFTLPNDDTGLTEFAVAEMDGGNGPDIVLASNEVVSGINTATKRVYLLRNPGGASARGGANWLPTVSPLVSDVPAVKAVKVADMDLDSDLDVVVTYPTAKSQNISWLVNPLVESGQAAAVLGNWTSLTVGEQRELNQPGDEQVPGADFLGIGDIDGDGAPDVVAAHNSLGVIQWFQNPGAAIVQQVNFPWDVFNIGKTATPGSLNQLQFVDLDQEGTLDVFVTGAGNMGGFERLTDVFNYWQPFTITGTNPIATIGKCAFSDVDGNGLLDIIAPMDRDGITNDQFLIILRLTP